MIFALGFLVASLCALVFLPVLNARAARLARRRVEASLPLSPREIAAERDHLRAGFAVERRRLERTVETALSRRHADLAAIGARTMEAAALDRTVKAQEADLAVKRTAIAGLEGALGEARTEGGTALAALGALEEAHAELIDILADSRARHRGVRDGTSEGAPAGGGDLSALREERDALRASLASANTALAGAREAALAEMRGENAELRRRIGEVADAVTGRERLPSIGAFPVKAMS